MATHVPQQAPHINSLNANGTQAPVIGTPSSAFGNHMFQSLSCAQHTSTTQYFTASANMPPLSSFDAGAAGHHNIGAGAVAYRQQLGPKRRRASQPCLGGGAGASRRTLDADILARIRPPSPEAKFTRKGGKGECTVFDGVAHFEDFFPMLSGSSRICSPCIGLVVITSERCREAYF